MKKFWILGLVFLMGFLVINCDSSKSILTVNVYGKVIEEEDGFKWVHYNSLKILHPGKHNYLDSREKTLDFDFTVGYLSNSYPVKRKSLGDKFGMAYSLRVDKVEKAEVIAAMRKELMKGRGRRSR